MISLTIHSLEEMMIAGKLIGNHLFPGSIVLLSGDLGTGKTTLAKSICSALGVNPNIVISPTYTIVNIYEGMWPICHADLFRLSSPKELEDFDWDELISEEGVTLVEWPEFLQFFLTNEPQLWISLQSLSGTIRNLEIRTLQDNFKSLFNAFDHYEHAHAEYGFSRLGNQFDKG